jgi:hypothetical protein
VIQAASLVGVRIIRAALALSALAGVMAAGSALRLRLHNERVRQNEKRNKLVRKIKQSTYPDTGIRGFAPGFPEPLEGFCDGPSIEPLVSPGLLGALANEASGSSSLSRPSNLESSRLTTAPWSQAAAQTCLPTRSEVTGHASAAPPTMTVGPLDRWIPFPRAPQGPSLPLIPPPSRRAPRLPSTPVRLTPRRQAPTGTAHQEGGQG